MADDLHFAPDPITLVCLLAAFACGLAAWADLLSPALLARYGQPVQAVVLHTETRTGAGDTIVYTYSDAAGVHYEPHERVPSLVLYGAPEDGQSIRARYLPAYPAYARLVGNESAGLAFWLLGAAMVIGLGGVANFRQWRYPDRSARGRGG